MGVSEEPILSRLDRLDQMMKQLEEIRGSYRWSSKSSPRSYPSTPTSATGGSHATSFTDHIPSSSPISMEKRCRPLESVMVEVGIKGNLIDRLHLVEDRMLKLCMVVEEEIEEERKKDHSNEEGDGGRNSNSSSSSPRSSEKKKGLKGLVRKIIHPHHHTHQHQHHNNDDHGNTTAS
ncbi:hypothetical protein LINPERHAP1_LOCUS17742 [Linum perenne]